MSFINDRFRRLVDAHHRKSSGKRQEKTYSMGTIGLGAGQQPPLQHQHGQGGGEGGDVDSNSSTYAEASIRTDPNVYAGYTSETKLPFSAFQSLRKQGGKQGSSSTSSEGGSHSPEVMLTEQQEANVMKALKRVADGHGGIEDSLPFVSAMIEKHCPALSEYMTNTVTRAGATFLLLAVMCGHKPLAEACLQLRAQPNSAAYLSWPPPPANEMEGEAPMTRHGFSPLFLAVICQRLEIAELLYAAGGYVGTTDRWGRTPLHAAYTLGDDEMVRWLLSKKALQSTFDRDRLRPGEDVHDVFPPPLARPRVTKMPLTKGDPATAGADSNEKTSVPDALGAKGTGQQKWACSATGNEAAMCHCQDCMEERLRLERAISNWLSPQYLEVLAAAADMERDHREQKASQLAATAHAQLHQQQLAEALGSVVREQQMQEQRLQATTQQGKGGAAGVEQAPSPAAVVGEAS